MTPLYILIALLILATPVMAIAAMFRTSSLKREIRALRAELVRGGALPAARPLHAAPRPPEAEAAESSEEAAGHEDIQTERPIDETGQEAPGISAEPEMPAAPSSAVPAEEQVAPRPGLAASSRFEEKLTSRWLVWLGGVTLALGGVFLFKYAMEHGVLGPTARVLLGGLVGAAMVAIGEWLRRHPLQKAIAAIRKDYVPPAVTAAGVVVLYASSYAAYGLYDLIPSLVAFVVLAAVSVGAFALSLLHGPFIAALGLLGAYAVPALVSTDTPNAWALFSYLAFVSGCSLAVLRFKQWPWLAWCTLAGSTLWAVFWEVALWRPGDVWPLALYLLLLMGLYLFVRADKDPGRLVLLTSPYRLDQIPSSYRLVVAAAAAVGLSVLILVRVDLHGPISLAAFGLLCLAFVITARRDPVLDGLPVLAAVFVLVLLATWTFPDVIDVRQPLILGNLPAGLEPGPTIPLQLLSFVIVGTAAAMGFAAVGFAFLWGAVRPGLWAAMSASLPLLILVVGYWRIRGFAADLAWSSVGLVLAALAVLAAAKVARHRGASGPETALGIYAVAVVAAISLAAAMSLERAWLTVTLAVQLPAMAWVHDRLNLPSFRQVALVLAGIVLVRLSLNHHVLDYPLGTLPGVNWILYGYGLPAIAFYLAARWFRRTADDRLVVTLEAGALLFAVMLVFLEIRHLVGDGPLDHASYDLTEQSLQSIAWLAMSYGLFRRYHAGGRVVPYWGWRILGALAVGQVILLQCIAFNPLLTGDDVGRMPIFNLLLLAYAAPAAFALLFYQAARQRDEARLAQWAGAAAAFLVFVYVTLELRRAFQGGDLSLGPTTDAELYSYSVAWLAYGAVLLVLGILRAHPGLRYASLVLVLLTVAKVFLVDMGSLTGLYRVASFLGLGACLVAIGYVYQRFILPRSTPDNGAVRTGQ